MKLFFFFKYINNKFLWFQQNVLIAKSGQSHFFISLYDKNYTKK